MDLGLLMAVVVEEQIESIDGFHVLLVGSPTAAVVLLIVGSTGNEGWCLFAVVDKRNTRLTFVLMAENLDGRRR